MTKKQALELLRCIEVAFGEGQAGSQGLIRFVVNSCSDPEVIEAALKLGYIP